MFWVDDVAVKARGFAARHREYALGAVVEAAYGSSSGLALLAHPDPYLGKPLIRPILVRSAEPSWPRMIIVDARAVRRSMRLRKGRSRSTSTDPALPRPSPTSHLGHERDEAAVAQQSCVWSRGELGSRPNGIGFPKDQRSRTPYNEGEGTTLLLPTRVETSGRLHTEAAASG